MKSILIIDDSQFHHRMVDLVMNDSEYSFLHAFNGSEGLDLLQRKPIAAVMLDLVMPDMDGFGFLREYSRLNLNVPVIVMTADIQEATKAQCLELGADYVFHKPVERNRLLSLLDDLTARDSSNEE